MLMETILIKLSGSHSYSLRVEWELIGKKHFSGRRKGDETGK